MKTIEFMTLGPENTTLKIKYAEEVYALLNESYKECGGINVGRGFESTESMIHEIPYWRLSFTNNKLSTVMMLKENKIGLKVVAYAPQSNIKKQIPQSIRVNDFNFIMNEAFIEASGALLICLIRHVKSPVESHILPSSLLNKEVFTVNDMLDKVDSYSLELLKKIESEFPKLLPHLYVRKIGTQFKIKMLVGQLNNNVTQ